MWRLRGHTDRQALSHYSATRHSARSRAGRNIEADFRAHPTKVRAFRYKMLGQLAAIARRRGVASILGLRFSGFFAWFLWRAVYLVKLPRLVLMKKVRVMLEWMLDLCFARDTVQLLTVHSVRSGRLDELIDSAQSADAVEIGPHPKLG
jgi:hypothetical protein